MKKTLLITVALLLGAASVHAADPGAGQAWRVPSPELYARVRIESTSVRWLAQVIGIEADEASCLGGNPRYRFPAGTGVMEFDLPVSVTQIGLCGQATAIGMDYKHIPVRLEAGKTTVIRNDEVVRAQQLSRFSVPDYEHLTKTRPLPDAAAADKSASRYDTSGCSVQTKRQQKGPVAALVTPVSRNNCWNLGDGGVFVEYHWTQLNNSIPDKTNIGFWVSLNNSAQYQKASAYSCKAAPQAGYSPDTSGNIHYVCAASAPFQFRSYPRLLDFAYDQSGGRNVWNIQVAVSLDDAGNWDSLNGSNYFFSF